MDTQDKKPRGNPNWKKKDMETENLRATHESDTRDAMIATTHAAEDRGWVDGRELSDEEFQNSIAFDGGLNQIMPSTPKIEGYHVMWASTMNEQDLRWRLEHGYSFVKVEEAQNFRHHTPRSAGIPGVISYNELVAVKIKKGREQMMAKKFHHDAPLNLESAIRKKASELMDYEGKKIAITMDEGTRELGRAPAKTPTFAI